MKKLFLCMLLGLLVTEINAQTYNLPPKKFYNKAILGKKDFTQLEVDQLEIRDTLLMFQSSGLRNEMPIRNLNYIRVDEGTYAKTGFAIGAGLGLVFVMSGVITVQGDPNLVLKKNAIPIGAAVSMGAGLVGALIGTANRREQSYYINAK